jgi:IS30 family transposase
VSREVRRNATKTVGYRPVTAHKHAEKRRSRPQERLVNADPVLKDRVVADLKRGRTPNQIAGRLRLERADPSVDLTHGSPGAHGRVVSHEAIYQWIYATPKGQLAAQGIMLQSKKTARSTRKVVGERSARIVGMRSIDERPDVVALRKVPGHWEGDLVVGKDGATAVATLVERVSRFVIVLGLPDGKKSEGLADVLIDAFSGLDELMLGSLTWDQGTEMARHAAVTAATDLPIFFAHPHSPGERGTNENTNRLVREYLPKGTVITDHQPFLTAISQELNDRPRACLGFYTPRERFLQLISGDVASTS